MNLGHKQDQKAAVALVAAGGHLCSPQDLSLETTVFRGEGSPGETAFTSKVPVKATLHLSIPFVSLRLDTNIFFKNQLLPLS